MSNKQEYFNLFINNRTTENIKGDLRYDFVEPIDVKGKRMSIERLDINSVGIPILKVTETNKSDYSLCFCIRDDVFGYIGIRRATLEVKSYYTYTEVLSEINKHLFNFFTFAYDNNTSHAYQWFSVVTPGDAFKTPNFYLKSDNRISLVFPLFTNTNSFLFFRAKIGFSNKLKILLSSFNYEYHPNGLTATWKFDPPFNDYETTNILYTLNIESYTDLPLNTRQLSTFNNQDYGWITEITQDASSLNFYGLERIIISANSFLKSEYFIEQTDRIRVDIPYKKEVLTDYNVSNESAERELDSTIIYIPKIRRYINFLTDNKIDRLQFSIQYKLQGDPEIYDYYIYPNGLIQIKLLIE